MKRILTKIKRIEPQYANQLEKAKAEIINRIQSKFDEESEKAIILEELQRPFGDEFFRFTYYGETIHNQTKEKLKSIGSRPFNILDILNDRIEGFSKDNMINPQFYSAKEIKEQMVVKALLWEWVKSISDKETIEKAVPKPVEMTFSDLHLIDELMTIGKRCSKIIKEKGLSPTVFNEMLGFIKNQFEMNRNVPTNIFEQKKIAFLKGVINPTGSEGFIESKFITSTKKAINKKIDVILQHIDGAETIQTKIFELMANGQLYHQIMGKYVMLLDGKRGNEFVRIYYVLDFIKLLCYIDGNTWKNKNTNLLTMDKMPNRDLPISKYLTKIDKLSNVKVNFEGKPFKNNYPSLIDASVIIPIDNLESTKILKEFLIECQEEYRKGKSVFLKWLAKRKSYIKEERISAVGQANAKRNKKNEEKIDNQINSILKFLSVYSELITDIEHDIIEESFANPKPIKEKNLTPVIIKESHRKNKFYFKNNFNNLNEEKIFEHFHIGLVKSKLLTEPEFCSFLKAAFENKQVPKQKFNLKNIQSKDKVMKVFYEFYKNISGKPHGKQKEYAGLLGEYFVGFKTSTVSTNFSKSVY